jgi:hypothetical protein
MSAEYVADAMQRAEVVLRRRPDMGIHDDAAASGIELTVLELRATSRSDTRGMLGMTEADGTRVGAGPRDVQLYVTIAAQGVPAEILRALVEESHRCSPVPCAMQEETSVELHIEVTND